jgi:hypothetical protein
MIGGDQLFNLERLLDDMSTRTPDKIEELCSVLRQIYDLPSYQTWLNASSPSISPYQLDPKFGVDVSYEMRKSMITWDAFT